MPNPLASPYRVSPRDLLRVGNAVEDGTTELTIKGIAARDERDAIDGAPVEGTPITIEFEVLSRSRARRIRIATSKAWVDLDLRADAPLRGSIEGVAPVAGLKRTVHLDLFHLPTTSPFPPPDGGAELLIDVAARYEARIESVVAVSVREETPRGDQPRPRDFLIGQACGLHGRSPIADPDASLGSAPSDTRRECYAWVEHDTPVEPHMRFGVFGGVPGKAPPLLVSWLFARAGSAAGDPARVEQVLGALAAAGREVARSAESDLSRPWVDVPAFQSLLCEVLRPYRDAVVAADKLVASSQRLAQLTDRPSDEPGRVVASPAAPHRKRTILWQGRGWYGETRVYRGRGEPEDRGGEAPEYHVTFVVERLSYPGRG